MSKPPPTITSVDPRAGQPVSADRLVDVPSLVTAYFTLEPNPDNPSQRVVFGTSGHRGSSFTHQFNQAHILAISQAICDFRRSKGIDGPLLLGIDTHALSQPALATAIEVLVANGVEVMLEEPGRYTPTPVISWAILTYNRRRSRGLADGIIITPSHNPPDEGGFKYNPPNGGPADTDITGWIETRANALMRASLQGVQRMSYDRALHSPLLHRHDFMTPYIADLASVIDLDAIASSGITLGIDPLGGASVHYWPAIAARFGLAATIVNPAIDPTFRFMTLDWDGKVRMDCSSPYAMASLIALGGRFDIAFANDTDADRHGIVTPSHGLMPPNDYLAAAIAHLSRMRPSWAKDWAVGKTIVSSGMIDRVTSRFGHHLFEVPVGFKWFSAGLKEATLGFAGEESAGASFLRRDGSVWTTDKDGLIMALLAAEITAKTGLDPALLYAQLTEELGRPFYARIDMPATAAEMELLRNLPSSGLGLDKLAGEPVTATLTKAPGNQVAFGGVKLTAKTGWFAVRPSGTEPIIKLYAESFRDLDHLHSIQQQASAAISRLCKKD